MKKLTLALDWTPNVNHIGFFIAKEKGYFQALGIDLDIIDPSEDNYAVTPAKKIELGLADFALCPTESIISYQTKKQPFDLVAIAAVLKEDLSAIAVTKASGIHQPKDLDSKTYSSYNARYEDGIVKEMIKNDGGQGLLNITYPEKLGIWEAVLKGNADATWVFLNWEGVQASKFSDKLKYFKMKDYGIPYSYSPVIVGSLSKSLDQAEYTKAFLKAAKEGFLYCQNNMEDAASILSKYVSASDKNINLIVALEMSVSHFGDLENWGRMDADVISKFMMWIKDKKLEHTDLPASEMYTNKFL